MEQYGPDPRLAISIARISAGGPRDELLADSVENFDVIFRDLRTLADQRQGLCCSLSHQHSAERVPVMHRQFNVNQQVWDPDLQLSKAGHGDRIEEFFRQLQFSDGRLDGAFPQGCGADVDDAAGIANGGSGPIRQGVRLAKRPKQGVGVQQVAHWR